MIKREYYLKFMNTSQRKKKIYFIFRLYKWWRTFYSSFSKRAFHRAWGADLCWRDRACPRTSPQGKMLNLCEFFFFWKNLVNWGNVELKELMFSNITVFVEVVKAHLHTVANFLNSVVPFLKISFFFFLVVSCDTD